MTTFVQRRKKTGREKKKRAEKAGNGETTELVGVAQVGGRELKVEKLENEERKLKIFVSQSMYLFIWCFSLTAKLKPAFLRALECFFNFYLISEVEHESSHVLDSQFM